MIKALKTCSALLALTLILFGTSTLARAEIGVVSPHPLDDQVLLTPATLPLLRGRWEGLWTLADGTRGHMKLQIQEVSAQRIAGVLIYHDDAYSDNDNILVDSVPELRDGELLLTLPGQQISGLRLKRSGTGYRLSWTSPTSESRQARSNEVSKGAVVKAPPPEIGNALDAVVIKDPGSRLPANWQHSGAFMQIYVRGYKDSNGDGIGDLKGVIDSLDYLQDLGVKGIWLMPVLASQDHDHGYAVSDYRAIEPAYGTQADLAALIKAAHQRGIGVIMDYVMNHSAAMNPIFANAASAPDNRYRDWYIWSESPSDEWSIYNRKPWHKVGKAFYFAGFSGSMPDWNLNNRAVVDYHLNNLRYWLNMGIDGFRFDAVGNLFENGPDRWESQPENVVLMNEVRTLLATYKQRYLVCEAPHNPLAFADACGSAFAFGHNKHMVKAAKGNSEAGERVAEFVTTAPPSMATMLANHDSFAGRRIFDQTKGDLAAYKLAAATYLTLPGIPVIYYGEEIGMAGGRGLSGDGELRTPMSWTADPLTAGFTSGVPFRALSSNAQQFNVDAERGRPDSLHSLYKKLLGLRNTHPALAFGRYEQLKHEASTLSFQRVEGKNRVLVLFNYSKLPAAVSAEGLPRQRKLKKLHADADGLVSSDAQGRVITTLPPQSFAIYQY